MAIEHQVLGEPGRDNALLARVWSGQAVHRLLFDCGEGCLSTLSASEVRSIDALCFSHFHIDHVAGFDSFLRLNFARPDAPVVIVGPEGTTRAIQGRLQGVTWNLVAGQPGEIRTHEVLPNRVVTTCFLTTEGFQCAHPLGEQPFRGTVFTTEGFAVEARIMDHGIPCLAYAVKENARLNIDPTAVKQRGLTPGPWMQALKDPQQSDAVEVEIGGTRYLLGELRSSLLVSAGGSSLAYLTDFALDECSSEDLATLIRGCEVIVGEASYRDQDTDLARRHRHFTGSQMGRLAAQVGARKLVLFHLSDRYTRDEWRALLSEVQRVFPATRFPAPWNME